MNKVLFFGVLMVLFFACKEKEPGATDEVITTSDIQSEGWPKKTVINAKAMAILTNWTEFKVLESSFEGLYKVENREDLALVIEELIEVYKLLEESTYPETFDIPQIKSRQKVFKTFFLKVKGNLEYRLDAEEPILEMIEAYNAFRNQFNVTINNNLDTQLILDDK